jgi:signal transduction histidine kinase
VFEEFYRVRSEQTHGITGAGLGLFLVKRLVEQHQGSIAVDSKPGKGSTFTVRLPSEG